MWILHWVYLNVTKAITDLGSLVMGECQDFF